MTESRRRARVIIADQSQPRLARFVKLRHDPGRKRWVLLAPERILEPNEVAIDVLQLCDGARCVSDIATALAEDYEAPAEAILADVIPMLQQLADDGFLD